MNKEQMNKYAYELMIKNNPEEAIKNLMLLDRLQERIDKANEELDYMMDNVDIPTYCGIKIKQILKGDSNE